MSVCVRVKPAPRDAMIAIWPKDAERGRTRRWVCCNRGYIMEEYEFSRIFGPEDANRNVYEELHGPALISSVFSGVNETLFAYGQTGSGKTHTIFGSGSETGLLQYFVREMFALSYRAAGSTIHACCYEIFGDTLTDLIEPEELIARGKLLDEDVVSDELFLKTQKCKYRIARVGSVETCVELLHKARINRACGVSSCNPYSSRSHAVVHLFVQNPSSEASDGGSGGSTSSSIGALTLVDLAGAEKEHDNPSEQGKSSARILNTSLSSLNRLLRKLQTNSLDESERRQSVLNKCLWEYLRPGCGISLIFCVSPLLKHRCTSLLRFRWPQTRRRYTAVGRRSSLTYPLPQVPQALQQLGQHVEVQTTGHEHPCGVPIPLCSGMSSRHRPHGGRGRELPISPFLETTRLHP